MKRHVLFLLLSAIAFAQSPREVEITAEPDHHLVIENDQVRVFYVDVPPNAETLLHWHRHDYVFVTLGPTEVVNAVKGKDPITQKLEDGDTRLVPGNFAHQVRDVASTHFRNVTVEILQDEKLRTSAAKWDEDRGLDILEGGTKQILWIKDGIRATEFELQPGAKVPEHHHNGPHLLVAVSDIDIRSDVSGTGPMSGPMPGHFKSGEAKWLPGNYSHTITNTGKQPAKFVTLEFP